MINYAIGLDKIDIARGRSVPAPAYGGNISSTLRRNLAMVSEYALNQLDFISDNLVMNKTNISKNETFNHM